MPFKLTAEEEDQFWTQLRQSDQQFQSDRLQALRQPQVAANLVQIHGAAPAAAPGVKLSLAQATAAGMLPVQAAIAAALSSYAVDTGNVVRRSLVRSPTLAGRIWSDVSFPFRRTRYENKLTPEQAGYLEQRTGVRPTNAVRTPAETLAGPPHFDEPGSVPSQIASIPKKIIRPFLAGAESGAQFQSSLILSEAQLKRAENTLTPEQAAEMERRTGVRPTNVRTPAQQTTVGAGAPAVGDIAAATTLGQAGADLVAGRPVEMGSGFLPAGTNETQRKYAERKVAGIIPGSGKVDANGNPIPGSERTATLGTFFSTAYFEPGSLPYQVLSPALDAYVAWYKDPFNIATKGVHDVRAARNVISPAAALSEAHVAAALRPGEEIVSHPRPISSGEGVVDHPSFGEGVWRYPDTPEARAAAAATAADGEAWQAYNDHYEPGLDLYNALPREANRIMRGDVSIFPDTRDAMYLDDVIEGRKRVMSVDDPVWNDIVKTRGRESGLVVREIDGVVYASKSANDLEEYAALAPNGALSKQREFELIGHNPTTFVPPAPPPTFVPIAEVRQEARVLRNEAGVLDTPSRWTVAPKGAEDFLNKDAGMNLKRAVAADAARGDTLSLMERFANRLDPDILVRLLDTKGDEAAVGEILLDEVLGHSVRGVRDLQKIRSPGWWESTVEWAPNKLKGTRAAQPMATGFQLTGLSKSTAERVEALNNIKHWMSNSRIPYEQKSALVGEFARAANKAERYSVMDKVQAAVAHSIEAYLGKSRGLARVQAAAAEEAAKVLTRWVDGETIRKYATDRTGLHTDGGFLQTLGDAGFRRDPETGKMVRGPLFGADPTYDEIINQLYDAGDEYVRGPANDTLVAIGPQMLAEGLGDVMYLPNGREIRRMTSKWWWVFTPINKGAPTGELRMPLAALEFIQNEVIKPLQIIRPAFLLRVIGEEQFRMAASGQSSLVAHPLDHIQLAMHNSGAYDALGQNFDQIAERMAKQSWYDEYAASLHRGSGRRGNKYLLDPLAAESDSFKTGSYSIVGKADQPEMWERGLASDEMRQMAHDTLTSKVAAGQTNDEIIAWLATAEGKDTQDELRAFLANKATRDASGKWVAVHLDADDPVVVNAYLDSLGDRLVTKVGGNMALREAIAKGTIGTDEITLADNVLREGMREAGPRVVDPFTGKASTWVGSTVRLPDDRTGLIVNNADEAGQSIVLVAGQAWDDQGRASEALKKEVRDWRLDPNSPDAVKVTVRAKERVSGYRSEAARRTHEMRNLAVNGFFAGIYGKSSDYLSRSPAFRQFYWQRATELADRLSPEEANKFLHTMEDAAANHTGNSVKKLLGGSDKRVDRAIAQAGKANGTLTLEQLDDYAKGWALDETKKLLYDATRRSQWSDIARVVMPFAEPWKEVITSWARIIKRDPRLVRRAQLVVEGGMKLDPDQDGRGFFHVDPATHQYVFSMPAVSEAVHYVTSIPGIEQLTGGPVDVTMNVPLKGLNIGWSVMPSLGWIASAVVGKLTENRPAFDEFRNFVLQGYTSGQSLKNVVMPSWFQKMWSAVMDGPRSTGMYADTYLRIAQVKLASGEYGNTPDELQRLYDDAQKQARAVMMVRGIVQATGPAAPSLDFPVTVHPKAKPGELNTPPEMNVMASTLASEYHRMLEEDPQNAVENFTMLYGDLALAFTVGRTRAINGGLDSSKEFGKWERAHGKVFSAAPDVAGYFAPVGDTPDSAVMSRHLATGQVVKLTDAEFTDAVNEKFANRMYYTLKDAIVAQNAAVGRKSLTTEQSDYLRDARDKIYQRFPVTNPNRYDRADPAAQMRQLIGVVDDKSLADNDIARAARDYLTLRESALGEVRRRGGGTLARSEYADLRAWLDSAGTALMQRTPTFEPLWTRVLSREVETQTTGG